MTKRATIASKSQAPSGLFPGWWQVAAGFGHAFLGYGVWLYGWGALAAAMTREFGWGAAQVAGVTTLGIFTGVIAAPLAGWMVDRRGPRLVSILGIGAAGLGFLLLGVTPGQSGLALAWIYFGYGVLVMLGMNGGLYLASFTAVNRWFVRRRGLALSLVTLGGGAGGIFLAPLCQGSVAAFGWRGAALIWGALTLGIGLPLAGLFRPHLPEHYGLRPDGLEPAAEGEPLSSTLVKDITLGQALGTWGFWAMAIAGFLHSYTATIFPFFQNLRLQQLGYAPPEVAALFSLQFVMALLGRTTVALVGDRFDPRWSVALVHGFMAAGAALFALAPGRDGAWLWAWMVLWGYAYGAWAPLSGALRGAYFGRVSFGRIWGIHNAVAGVGGLMAPIVAGWAQMALGARWSDLDPYQIAYLLGAGATMLAALFYASAPHPKGQFSHRQVRRGWVDLETQSTDGTD